MVLRCFRENSIFGRAVTSNFETPMSCNLPSSIKICHRSFGLAKNQKKKLYFSMEISHTVFQMDFMSEVKVGLSIINP